MRIFVASLIVFAVLYFWCKITTTANYWMGLTACDEPSPTICFIKEMSAGAESEEMRNRNRVRNAERPLHPREVHQTTHGR